MKQLYQYSTIAALMGKALSGSLSVLKLKKQGDFGIGTFHGVDGEMVILDGIVYQVAYDSSIHIAKDEDLIPYALTTFFEEKQQFSINNKNYLQIQEILNANLPSKNCFYAIKIEGVFSTVNVRIAKKQNPPYPSLEVITKTQNQLTYNNVKGTIVGFYSPAFAAGIGVGGYHLHFIDDQKTMGGHVFNFDIQNATAFISDQLNVVMDFPNTDEYLNADIDIHSLHQKIEKVENAD